MTASTDRLDCLIAGGGPVGLTAAIALEQHGYSVLAAGIQLSASETPLDPRTFALFQPSLRFLENLGVCPLPEGVAAPLEAIRLIDDTGRLLRAPEAVFEAREMGLECFGLNVPQSALVSALLERLRELIPDNRIVQSGVAALNASQDHVDAELATGLSARARLVIGADGRQSTCRRLGGFATRRWSYPQTAIVASIAHSRPHANVSTELHRPAGPLTTVPLPGHASSIVWVEHPTEASRIEKLDDADFASELHVRLQGFLGRIEGVGPRRAFPLEGLVAEPAARDRVALVGEALHAIPPIGAQGLNLGFRDVASLLDALTEGSARDAADPGCVDRLSAYARDRKQDVSASVFMVDALDRSLFAGFVPLQLARGAGLQLANASASLRRSLMYRGMGEFDTLPRLMREERLF